MKFRLQSGYQTDPLHPAGGKGDGCGFIVDTAEEYEKYFHSDEVNRLIQELIADKLAISQIMALLREQPRSTGELSEMLGLAPAEVSRYMSSSARQGLARFDESRKRFVPA